MPIDDRNKLNRIEDLKTKLFSKNYQTKIEHRDNFTHLKEKDVPDDWGDGDRTKFEDMLNGNKFYMKSSVFKNFFIFSLVFFLFTLGYGSYVFFGGGNTVSNDNINISVLGNNFVAGGEELSLVVGITNKNSSALDLADLVVEYPKNPSDPQAQTEHLRTSLGTIPAGAVRNESIKATFFGEQGSTRTVKITLEYRVEGSNAIFVKDKLYDVTINSTPLNLSVGAPDTISPNQEITLNVKETLNATNPISNMLLRLDYPVGFQFESASPAPTFGNNVWNLGDLAPGADRNIAITGKMVGVFDGEEKVFHVSSGSQSESNKSMIDVVYNSIIHTVIIKKPFIEAHFFVNGVYQKEYASSSKNSVYGEIRWNNNLDTAVTDMEIRAKISGNALNRKTINVEQGFYDSSSDVIIWNKSYQDKFKEISPGDSGSVNFSFSPLSLFSASGGILGAPAINIDISISGKQSVIGYDTVDLKNFESSVVKIISDVGLTNKALYYSGTIKNTGPIPPKAEQATTYTIVWTLSNTANSISKAVVRATLPAWVKFVGSVLPASESLTYNESTREIVWNVDRIPKGTGIAGVGKEVSFQISLTPSLSQVGTSPIIIRDAVLTGHDDFANVDIRTSKPSLSTALYGDPLFPPNGSAVTE